MGLYSTPSRITLTAALILASLLWLGLVMVTHANGITVTSAADTQSGDGQCTLREAILNANNDDQSGSVDCNSGGGSDMITFSGNYTITLNSALPNLNSPLSLDGTGRLVTISGSNSRQIFHILTGGDVSLTGLTLSNGSTTGNGGAILVELGAILTVTNSTLSGNSADSGGAIFNQGTLTLSNSTLSGNNAVFGGGIRNNGTLTINNSTLSGNSATNFGGGVFNFSGTLTMFNATFSANSATIGGGGLFNQNVLNFSNSLIANSSSGGDCQIGVPGTIVTNLNNLVEDGSCNTSTTVVTGFVSGDPRLSPLRGNGGSTLTHALLPGSPALNAGANAACLGTDQRNISRPQQGTCDIGAFESHGFSAIRGGGNNQSTAVDTTFVDPLTLTIKSAFAEPVGPGGAVKFTAPASGASLNPTVLTATTSITGVVSQLVTANSLVGSYNVTATASGISTSVSYALTNTPCVFTLTVTTANDSGPGSLRQSLAEVCQGGTLTFNNSLAHKTIPLVTELKLNKFVTVTNPNAPGLQISGNNSVRVFHILVGGHVILDRLGIISGSTTGVGGGIIIDSGAILTVTNSTLTGNSAVRGGGIDNRGTLNLTNSTLSGNSATSSGGGLRNRGALTIINSTLSNNSSASSGGLVNRATMNFSNTLIANSSSGGDCDNFGTIVTNSNNLIEDGSCDDNAVSFISKDPQLGPLQNNGGPTLTHALLPGSPAVNGGDNTAAAGLTFDQRGAGFPRIRGANIDIGAFESKFSFILYMPKVSKKF